MSSLVELLSNLDNDADKIAIIEPKYDARNEAKEEEHLSISFKDLNGFISIIESNLLELTESTQQKNSIIGIFLPPSITAVCAILGSVRAHLT